MGKKKEDIRSDLQTSQRPLSSDYRLDSLEFGLCLTWRQRYSSGRISRCFRRICSPGKDAYDRFASWATWIECWAQTPKEFSHVLYFFGHSPTLYQGSERFRNGVVKSKYWLVHINSQFPHPSAGILNIVHLLLQKSTLPFCRWRRLQVTECLAHPHIQAHNPPETHPFNVFVSRLIATTRWSCCWSGKQGSTPKQRHQNCFFLLVLIHTTESRIKTGTKFPLGESLFVFWSTRTRHMSEDCIQGAFAEARCESQTEKSAWSTFRIPAILSGTQARFRSTESAMQRKVYPISL